MDPRQHITKRKKKKKKKDKNAEPKQNQKVVAILGDSIIKDIQGNRLSTNEEKVVVKCFRGAKTECMYSYTIPPLKENPDIVLLHCGTNDLKKEEDPNRVAQNIVSLATHISSKNSDKPVIVSSLVCRDDRFRNKIENVNLHLHKMCNERNIGYVENNNVKKNHLNKSKLHLNSNGTAILVRNFKEVISN